MYLYIYIHNIKPGSTKLVRFARPQLVLAICRNNQQWCVTVIGFGFCCTPLKINMKPKNHPIEKDFHVPNLHFRVPAVNFPGCIWLLCCRIVEYGCLGCLEVPMSDRYAFINGSWTNNFPVDLTHPVDSKAPRFLVSTFCWVALLITGKRQISGWMCKMLQKKSIYCKIDVTGGTWELGK